MNLHRAKTFFSANKNLLWDCLISWISSKIVARRMPTPVVAMVAEVEFWLVLRSFLNKQCQCRVRINMIPCLVISLEIWHEFTDPTPNHFTKPVVWRWWPSIDSFKLLHKLEWIIFQWPIFVMDLLKTCNTICLLPKFFCWQKGIAEINICLVQTQMAKCNRTGIWEENRALLNGHQKLFRFLRWRFKLRGGC